MTRIIQMKGITYMVCLMTIATLLSVQLGCGRNSNPEAKKEEEGTAVPVEIGEVTVGDIADYFTGTAALEAEDETEVVAKVGGVVKRILVEEGDYVTAGRVLARLDDEKLAVQMEQATANSEKSASEFQRCKDLFDEHLISAQDYQKAKYEYEHQKAAYDLCKLDLEYASIRTPIGGVIAERLIKVGNMVLPNQSVFRVTDLDPLLAVLHVPERQIGTLEVGHVATLKVDAVPNEEFTGSIERISPVVDPSTGTVKVTVVVHDTSRKLKPGMFARIQIIHDVHASATLAPREAIMEEDNEISVFVVQDSTAYRRIVETGYVNSTHTEVLKGLEPGDTVVTIGKGSLKDSTKVEFVSDRSSDSSGSEEASENQ